MRVRNLRSRERVVRTPFMSKRTTRWPARRSIWTKAEIRPRWRQAHAGHFRRECGDGWSLSSDDDFGCATGRHFWRKRRNHVGEHAPAIAAGGCAVKTLGHQSGDAANSLHVKVLRREPRLT